MNADKAVAEKKMNAYRLPPALLKEFSPEAIEEMRVTFALFDESGDGALDEEELGALLRTFGQEPTKDKVLRIYEVYTSIICTGVLRVHGDPSDYVLRLPFESTELSSERWRSDGTTLLGSGKTKGSHKAKRYDKAGIATFSPILRCHL